jgi:type I restriction enzyme S subunit
MIMNSTNNEILPEGYRMTELGALPEEWEVVRLGEVAEISSGGSAPQGDEYFKGDKPFIRVSHIDNEDYSIKRYDLINDKAIHDYKLTLFPKGTIVFPKSGATVYLEKRAMLPIDAFVVSHLCAVRSNNEEILQLFLFYILRSLKLAKEKADGYPTLNISEIKEILLPLPPLPEQKRIAAVLSAVQEAKEKTQAVIDATKGLKKSMMKHLFTYGPVPPEEAENVPLKETELGKVPEEWEVVKLGEVAEVNYGKANTKDKGNIPVVGSGGVYSSTKTPLVDYPTIVIGRKGTAGKAWLFVEPCYPSDTTFYLRWKKDIDLKFLYNYMVLNPLSGEHAKTTLPSLQKADLINYLIPLPPLPIQQKIASILSAIDAKIEAEENKKKSLEDLFKTLLHNLMTAKIRVDKHRINLKENEL